MFWNGIKDAIDELGSQGGILDSLGGAVGRYEEVFGKDDDKPKATAQPKQGSMNFASLLPVAYVIGGSLLLYGLIVTLLGKRKK